MTAALMMSGDSAIVYGSHCGLGHNPAALWAIMDRLALPEDEWSPFDRHLYRTLAFPKPDEIDPS